MGSGPSLCPDDIELARSAGAYVLACNDNWLFQPDMLYVPDHAWINVNQKGWRTIKNRWTCSPEACKEYPGWEYIAIDHTAQERLLSLNPEIISHGENAGFQMLNLAVLMGASKILLTGYDLQNTDGKVRWKGLNPPGVEKSTSGGKYQRWIERMEPVAPQLQELNIEVINASRSTALRCFPIMPIEEALDHVMETTLA